MAIQITSSEFRKNVSTYLNKVEQGETIQLFRHNRLVAELMSPINEVIENPSWRKLDHSVKISGQLMSEALIRKRK